MDNDSYITLWNICEANERANGKRKPVHPDWEKEMKIIRRTHICSVCKKYPGDRHYSFGTNINGRYHCFECIPIDN